MGFRFNKRLKIAPGLSVNLSLKRGLSASIGVKGASHNIGLDGRRRTTVSAPGTGLSHVTEHTQQPRTSAKPALLIALILAAALVGAILTA